MRDAVSPNILSHSAPGYPFALALPASPSPHRLLRYISTHNGGHLHPYARSVASAGRRRGPFLGGLRRVAQLALMPPTGYFPVYNTAPPSASHSWAPCLGANKPSSTPKILRGPDGALCSIRLSAQELLAGESSAVPRHTAGGDDEGGGTETCSSLSLRPTVDSRGLGPYLLGPPLVGLPFRVTGTRSVSVSVIRISIRREYRY